VHGLILRPPAAMMQGSLRQAVGDLMGLSSRVFRGQLGVLSQLRSLQWLQRCTQTGCYQQLRGLVFLAIIWLHGCNTWSGTAYM
jgi:hypothetical protein